MSGQLHIHRLSVSARLGVTDAERQRPQRVEISLTCPAPATRAAAAEDDLALTVDYFAVSQTLARVAAAQPRKLLETLAEDLCAAVLAEFAVGAVTLEVRKFAIPDAAFVSLTIERRAAPAAAAAALTTR